MPTATWAEARARKPVAYPIGRDAPYITRAPTSCSTSPYVVVNSSPAETAWTKMVRVLQCDRDLQEREAVVVCRRRLGGHASVPCSAPARGAVDR
ncbi:hypothetical protein SMICM17S_07417 [Streptomyces microflavus]